MPVEENAEKDAALAVSSKRWLWEAFCLLIFAYTIAVVFGIIPSTNRLSTNEILLIGFVAVGTLLKLSPQWVGELAKAWPKLLNKLEKVKVGSLEFELREVKQEVKRFGGDLEHLRLMLALTLPERAQVLLIKALESEPYYPVDKEVRSALRRLADQGLLVRKPSGNANGEDKKIGEIASGASFLDTVTLTEQGKRVAQLVSQIRRDENPNG